MGEKKDLPQGQAFEVQELWSKKTGALRVAMPLCAAIVIYPCMESSHPTTLFDIFGQKKVRFLVIKFCVGNCMPQSGKA